MGIAVEIGDDQALLARGVFAERNCFCDFGESSAILVEYTPTLRQHLGLVLHAQRSVRQPAEGSRLCQTSCRF